MPLKLLHSVDGGCRGNGMPSAYGAAACFLEPVNGSRASIYDTKRLPNSPIPTDNRAELIAVIMAPEWAIEEYEKQHPCVLEVEIRTDSTCVRNCLTNWVHGWQRNG